MSASFDLKINCMARVGDGSARATSASLDEVNGAVGAEPSVQRQRASVPPAAAARASVCGRSVRIGEVLVLPEPVSAHPLGAASSEQARRAPLSTLPERAAANERAELDDPIEFGGPESSSRTPLHKVPSPAVAEPSVIVADRAEELPVRTDIHGMRLIVVEDDPSLADAMARQLRALGAVVAIAENGEQRADEAKGSRLKRLPRWLLVVAVAAMVVLAVVAVFGRSFRSGAAKDGSEGASLAAPDPAPRQQPTPPSLAARAELGDRLALAELESRTPADRSVEEVLAMSRGRDLLERRSITEVGEHIEREPSIGTAPHTLRRLKQAAADPILYTEALQVIASLPGATAADLLHDVWLRTGKRQPANELAKRLLHADAVRNGASPALQVALELRTVDRCDQLVSLLPHVTESGDRRSLSLIVGLPHRKCAPARVKNCYSCVHGNPELRRAILAASKRPAPTFN